MRREHNVLDTSMAESGSGGMRLLLLDVGWMYLLFMAITVVQRLQEVVQQMDFCLPLEKRTILNYPVYQIWHLLF